MVGPVGLASMIVSSGSVPLRNVTLPTHQRIGFLAVRSRIDDPHDSDVRFR